MHFVPLGYTHARLKNIFEGGGGGTVSRADEFCELYVRL